MTKHTQNLVTRAASGDGSAWDLLVSAYRERLETVIRSRLSRRLEHRIEVADIAQETFLRAFRSLPSFTWEGETPFFQWLCGIANHVILKAARRDRRRPVLRLQREISRPTTSPSRDMRRHERFDRLEQALAGLNPEHRKVIIWARIKGLPIKEIAERMNKSRAAVSMLLTRALRDLRRSFGDTESLGLPHRVLGEAGDEDDG